MDDLIPIGEFSERSGLSPKRLRTYAAGGLLVPAAVDPSSGYRYYSPGQVREARLIDALRNAGMSLADIGAFLRDPSMERLSAWMRRLQVDAAQRQESLDLARQLLATEATTFPHPIHEQAGISAMNTFTVASRTDIGRVRDSNEDAVAGSDRLAVVADGMGGHSAGEVASGLAVSLVQAAFTGRSLDELEAAVRAANRAVWDRADGDVELEGMGTTLCAAGLTDDGNLAVAHVGDSRVYLLRDGSLRQLTQDHSLTAELVRRGELRESETLAHPLHGVITRVLGGGPNVDVDGLTQPVTAGDRLLLCSDGLFNELHSDEITSMMTAREPIQQTADALVELALSRGGQDNISVVLAEVSA